MWEWGSITKKKELNQTDISITQTNLRSIRSVRFTQIHLIPGYTYWGDRTRKMSKSTMSYFLHCDKMKNFPQYYCHVEWKNDCKVVLGLLVNVFCYFGPYVLGVYLSGVSVTISSLPRFYKKDWFWLNFMNYVVWAFSCAKLLFQFWW